MYVPLPPEGVSVALNGTPTSHSVGRGTVANGFDAAILSGFRTVNEYVWKCLRDASSSAWTWNW